MKKTSLLILLVLYLVSCSESKEKDPDRFLQLAIEAYNRGAYDVAREKIDSIRMRYPKALQTRREAMNLRLKVDLAEGKQAVIQADQIISQKQDLVERMKKKLVLEPMKGAAGNYVSPLQTLNKIGHNMLRVQVDERGLLTLTSIYCGKMNHRAVKVSAGGKSVQTPTSKAFFESECDGKKLEEVVFSQDHEVGICAFISQHIGQPIELTYIASNKSQTVTLQPQDVQAISAMYDFYLQLKVLNDARVHYADACEKVKFINQRIEESGVK